MTAIEYLVRAQSAYEAKQYVQALSLIADAEAEGKACAESLLLKGACIQLAEGTDFPVDYALRAYDDVLSSQPHNARAWLEKGFFLLNVSDSASPAKVCFSEAARLFGGLLEMALAGLGQSATESGVSQTATISDMEVRLDEILKRVRVRLSSS